MLLKTLNQEYQYKREWKNNYWNKKMNIKTTDQFDLYHMN